jgi:hypothetical protein
MSFQIGGVHNVRNSIEKAITVLKCDVSGSAQGKSIKLSDLLAITGNMWGDRSLDQRHACLRPLPE